MVVSRDRQRKSAFRCVLGLTKMCRYGVWSGRAHAEETPARKAAWFSPVRFDGLERREFYRIE
jgi:hypothetical protein